MASNKMLYFLPDFGTEDVWMNLHAFCHLGRESPNVTSGGSSLVPWFLVQFGSCTENSTPKSVLALLVIMSIMQYKNSFAKN